MDYTFKVPFLQAYTATWFVFVLASLLDLVPKVGVFHTCLVGESRRWRSATGLFDHLFRDPQRRIPFFLIKNTIGLKVDSRSVMLAES